MTLEGFLALYAHAREFNLYNALMNLICEKLDNNNSMPGRIVRHAAAFLALFPNRSQTLPGIYRKQRLMLRLHDIYMGILTKENRTSKLNYQRLRRETLTCPGPCSVD